MCKFSHENEWQSHPLQCGDALSVVCPIQRRQALKSHVINSRNMFCFIDSNHLFNKKEISNIQHFSTFKISGKRDLCSTVYNGYKRVHYQLRMVKICSLLIRTQHSLVKQVTFLLWKKQLFLVGGEELPAQPSLPSGRDTDLSL